KKKKKKKKKKSTVKKRIKVTQTKCCCRVVQLQTFFNIQAVLSALTFWSIWGCFLLAPDVDNVLPTAVIFTIVSTWWNPTYYSVARYNLRTRCSFAWFWSYLVIGVCIGLIQLLLLIYYWNGRFISKTHTHFKHNFAYFSSFRDPRLIDRHLYEWLQSTILCLGGLVSIVYYFPMVGYLFYRTPITFGISHLFCAICSLFIPLLVRGAEVGEKTIYIFGNEVKIHWSQTTLVLISLVVLSIFLASSGLSCTYFRNKKAIVRSQSSVAGKTGDNVEVHMVCTSVIFLPLYFHCKFFPSTSIS
ncbi:hypothetical protein RFI_08288, partial [Reticulomyxa filosa]